MDEGGRVTVGDALDIGEDRRRVEQHLTRVNAGHLVRIVGPGFELVRTWAREGMPLSIVLHGITLKAERHHAVGRAARPLRLEFCESDVRAVFEQWRRAVGLPASMSLVPGSEPSAAAAAGAETSEDPRRVSLSKHLERAGERLSRAAGRLELPEAFREAVAQALDDVVAIREQAKKARGPARDDLGARLLPIDAALLAAARHAITLADLSEIEAEAKADLAPYRNRLAAEVWQRSVDVTVDRLLRERLGLPVLELP